MKKCTFGKQTKDLNMHLGNEMFMIHNIVDLTLSWQRPLSYRNQSIDNGLRHERVKQKHMRHYDINS